MDERNASQNFINLNIGQLLNLLDNVNKNYVRKLEKLNKNFVNNKYGISFNYIYTDSLLILDFLPKNTPYTDKRPFFRGAISRI